MNQTDDLAHISPAIIATSNLIYVEDSLISWRNIVETFFQFFDNENMNKNKLKKELVLKLELIEKELYNNNCKKSIIYVDLLPVSFESKIRLVLSILKVNRGIVFYYNIQYI